MEQDSIRSKLAKLLRLQQSPNANEAANAAAKVAQLCAEHGLSVESIDSEFDSDKDTAMEQIIYTKKAKINSADAALLNAVVRYFNGCLITAYAPNDTRTYNIFATKGNHNQIALYFDYLLEARERLLKEAKMPPWENARAYNNAWRLNFAYEINRRLRAMAEQAEETAKPIHGPGLVAMKRPEMERHVATTLSKTTFPHTSQRRAGTTSSAAGRMDGKAAGSKVSLHKQATGSSNSRALGGGR